MSSLSSGIGLISGLDINAIVETLTASHRAATSRLQNRVAGFEATQAAIKSLEANLLTLTSSVQVLQSDSQFSAVSTSNSDKSQLRVTAFSSAQPGSYNFQAVRLASAHQVLSTGFANSDQQAIGAGTLKIASGGGLHQSTLLGALNGGEGVSRGTIRIGDRSGATADIDLTDAYTVDDVLDAINNADGIGVSASAQGGQLVIEDTTGSTASNLTVVDLDGGSTAADLGINQSVADTELTGDEVYYLTGDFTLDYINDGNTLSRFSGAPDIRFTLSDDSVIDVNLDNASTLDDVVTAINDHEDNGGKLSAALVDGHLELTDLSGGGGTETFAVEDINGSSVVDALGIDVASSGDTITGERLLAGISSVLLRNLRGGQGFDQIGEITLTDRAGTSATIDLAGVESLDEVLQAINDAESSGATKLQLTARVNDAGTGIVITDNSTNPIGNLTITDEGGSTIATQLGITIDADEESVDSGNINLRYVNEATLLDTYAPDGSAVSEGSFLIIDSSGAEAVISVTSAVKTIGDVIQRINTADGVSVTAELNETGDGFVLIDEAGGGDPLEVQEITGTTAAELRILGEGELNGANYEIASRRVTQIDIDADDTLNDLVEQINSIGGIVSASVIDDGSLFNSKRLSLTSTSTGVDGRFFVEQTGLTLELSTVSEGEDALLRVGTGAGAFLKSSSSNSFEAAVTGIDVEALTPSETAASVEITRKTSNISGTIEGFVAGYNAFLGSVAELTKFDAESNTRGILQGSSVTLRASSRLDSIVNKRFFGEGQPFDSLFDLGVRVGLDGKLSFDKSVFNAAVEQDFDGVADFFLGPKVDLSETTLLAQLNQGEGVTTGTMRITDRSGASAEINLTGVATIGGVIDAINGNADIAVTATIDDGRIVLSDTSGSTDSDLVVEDLDGGSMAADLGIEKSVASATLTGSTLEFRSDGAAKQLQNTIDSLTDPFTGLFAIEVNSLQDSADSLTRRIDQLNDILDSRTQRLVREFFVMEEILGQLTSQQNSIANISALRINPVGKGILP